MNRVRLNSNTRKGRNIRRIISYLLIVAIFVTSLSLDAFSRKTEAAGGYVTLYLKDDTATQWIGNDNAVIELVDNTYGHDRYIMTKVNSTTWSCKVPASIYNVTFNRLSPDKSTQWNSWSAGGRDGHCTYHATVPEHGYWDGTAVTDNEYFHEGDIIYLDFYGFLNWEQANAVFYVNFKSYSKADNNEQDITISSADSTKFSPILLTNEIETQVFKYVVTAEDEGATSLRFFRGNSTTLWNNSVVLNYSDYKVGNNCVKVQGWDNTGYVCPYVPRRHITRIDSATVGVTGNRKVNRKIEIHFNLTGETDLLLQEDTEINIVKLDSNGNEVPAGEGEVYFILDETVSQWNHRELIFKQAGNYKISAVATDGYEDFSAETTISVVKDAEPQTMFDISCGEGESTNSPGIYVRNSEGTAHIFVTDASVSEFGDEISERTYVLYHDANNDGEFSNDEIIDTKTGNETEVLYELNTVGKYRVVLNIKETFTDTIPSLVDDSVYLRGSYAQDFETANQAPVSAMYMEKSNLSDIIFTAGNADGGLLSKYAEVTAGVEEKLAALGIDAKVSTVSTSALTAQDTFAWIEYDHNNYADWYNQCLPKHIQYNGSDIKMVGYFQAPLKDFLYVADKDSSRKVFEFDLQRDATDWHSMEGGGFLFNTVVSEDENYIQGYCILITGSGLKLVQINKTNLSGFRNGSYQNVQHAGRLLQTFGISNLYANHHFKIIIDGNNITVYDGDNIVINEYTLPDDGVEAYGYGPLISHISHGCSQQSYFTFKNIVMQTITGESLSDVVNNHEWTPGTNHYVINLSETSVPELSDNDRMADVAAALTSKDAMFFGIGNENTIDQYNSLVNAIDGKGENISLTYTEEDDEGEDNENGEDEETDEITIETAVDRIVERITADIESKDYSIGYTITTDEKVIYKDTYNDPEGDEAGTEIWEYVYDASVFGEKYTEPENIQSSEPITMFANAGAYTVTHKVSDDPTKGNTALDSYIRWADTDEYQKIILAQNRPSASVMVTMTQKPSDSSRCMVNVIYECKDPDHPSDEKKGIREEKFYYREIGETEWIEGRFPTEVAMGSTYLIKYQVKDIEGTWSRPAVQAVRTSEAREYVRPDDTTPPQCSITVSKETVEIGETLYIEAVATDDYGVTGISLKVNGNEIATQPGRYSYVPDEAGNLEITLTASDICGNEGTAEKTVRVADKSDITPPTIIITSPKNGTVTGNVDIMGTITDDKALALYRVVQSRVITEEGQTDEQEEIVLAEGTKEIIDGKLATVEAESLESGTYKIEITATDKAGLSSSVYMLLTVEKTESGDRIPPAAMISDIALDNENSLIEITGTVSDETELKNYILNIYKKNSAGNDSEEILSVTGNQAKSEEILGTVSTQGLASGDYSVILMAEDSAGNQTTTKAGFIYTAGTSSDDISRSSDTEPPVIIAELNAEIKNESLKINLRGTIADESSLVYTVILGKKQSDGLISEALIIAAGDEDINDAEIASYSLKPYETGDYALIIEAEDAYGNLRKTEYTITVTPNGTVDEGYGGEAGGDGDEPGKGKLNLVLGRTAVSVEESVTAYLTYPDTAENVKLVLKNKKTEQESDLAIHGRTAEITAASYGKYEVILSADINGEKQSVSADLWFLDAADDTHPVAELITPESESILKTITDITGTVSDDKELKYYTLEYKQEGTDDYIELSRGTEPVINGTIGTLDTTKLLNGRYVLRLTAVDMAGHRIRTERYIYVEGNLKVGNMSIGFTDITSNVAGIPLSLTRNYDSRNKASGDFGTGWSMGLMDVRLKESSDICTGYSMTQVGQMLSTGYYLTQISCHDVVVTYGDGTSDRFELTISPERQALIPIYQVTVGFRCVTNPKLKLSINGGNTAMLYGSNLMFDDFDMLEYHSYILTREDGTKLYLDETHGLLSMEDTNGNKVSVTNAGFKHSDGNGITFTRDEHNRIIRAEETSNNGSVINKVEYAYDSNDNLIRVTDNADRTVGYTYDDNHNLIDIIDPMGIAVARNVYDEDGRLVATVDADGNRIEYEHDLDGRTEIVRDKLGNVTVYTYDTNGNILKTVDALGNITTNTYDENNKLLTKLDALGNMTSYEYDAKGNRIRQSCGNGTEVKFSYNEFNLVNSVSMHEMTKVLITYDSKSNLTSTIDANGNETDYEYESNGKLKSISDEIGVYRRYTYDNAGRLAGMSDANGNIINYEYDDKGYLRSKSTVNSYNNQVISVNYLNDEAGNVIQEIAEDGTIIFYEYNDNDKLTAKTDSLHRRTEYTYDNSGNLKVIQYPDGTTDSFTYDAMGNTVGTLDRNGISSTMIYDKLGQLSKIKYSNGTEESYEYDAVGNMIKQKSISGAETSYEYDKLYRNTSITDAYGNKTSYEYNDFSQLIKVTDAKGNIYRYEYDYNGNQTKIIYPDGSTISYEFDARNRKISETDAEGNKILYTYDKNDNLTGVIDALNHLTTYEYDHFGNISKSIDANGNYTEYLYDDMNRLHSVNDMQGNTIKYDYDDAGRLIQVTDKCGSIIEYTYNENDLLVKEHNIDGDIIYSYNDLNQLISVTDKNGVIDYSYDDFNRLLSKRMYDDVILRYSYDECNRLECKKLIIDNQEKNSTTYEYDILDRITRVVDKNGTATVYEYDALGNRQAVTYPNGEKIIYTYDPCSRLKEECVTDKDNVLLYKYVYSRNKKGNVVKISEYTADNQLTTQYQYDDMDKLIREEISTCDGSIFIFYNYDAVGNRLEKNVEFSGNISAIAEKDSNYCNITEGKIIYSYNSLNQLIREVNGKTEALYIYDRNGNLIRNNRDGCTIEYTYDAKNQLLKISKIYGQDTEIIETYSYDYAGNRIRKTTEKETILYVIDDNTNLAQVEAEITENHKINTLYNRGQELISMENNSEVLYYIYDGHGDVRALVNGDGGITDTYRYDAYGNLLRKTGTTDNKYLYTGQYYDESTGLYYLRARYVNFDNGNFLTMDTYDGNTYEPVSLHKYLYAQSNPVTYTDPTGHFAMAWGMAAESELRSQQMAYDAMIMRIGMSLIASLYSMKAIKNATNNTYCVIDIVMDDIDWITITATESIDEIKAKLETKLAATSISRRGDGNIYTVYTLMDAKKVERYVGRTKNLKERLTAHRRPGGVIDKYKLTLCKSVSNLTYEICRGLEQLLMVSVHTRAWLGEKGYNKINGISPTNVKKDLYIYEALTYYENQKDNERLNLEEAIKNPWR